MYYSLAQDEILFLLWWVKKEIKTHLVLDCLSKFTFGQGFTQLINESYLHLYHTCVKKSTYRRMTMKTQAIEVTNLAKSFELSKGKTVQLPARLKCLLAS